ncbi:general secretion pathway protein GspK [Peredibacter sp. HCB2-198]|uniref:general secretion pathway protein GspK n=1 Tax=Peredibacter sp. HCB2-198 TaxID=3383025 RepID=UPI0038B4F64A
MMGFKKDLQKIMNNERGIALMMILTAIIILMAIYGEFTFESKISRIKATNILDRSQAKLLAESGLQLAMTRLRLYKEAYNYVQGNQNAKQAVSSQLLNQLWEVPFIYPIPVGGNATRAFKDTVEKFEFESLLDGQMKVSIQNISNRLNLNMLRIDMTKFNPDQSVDDGQDENSTLNMNEGAILTDVSVDQSLFFLLKRLVDDKKEKDEAFADRYGSINYQELLTNLKYYMSDYQSMNQDPLVGEAESNFQQIPLAPKYGPLSSASELYTIPGWNDELIELIHNEFSVYPSTQIDFNKLTTNMFKILIPQATDDDIKEFFIWRDDPEQPRFLNSLEDFKKYIVQDKHLMNETDFDNRMKLFQQKGISFGSNPNLFKIVSEGSYNRSNYTLVAYVVLPKNSVGQATAGTTGSTGTTTGTTTGGSTTGTTTGGSTTGGTTAGANQNAQLLEPRIIEIQIN